MTSMKTHLIFIAKIIWQLILREKIVVYTVNKMKRPTEICGYEAY